MPTPNSPTSGVRTWRRTGADAAAPVAERVIETTRPADMVAALAEADFVTIPRHGADRPGYSDAYAEAFAAALAERFDYAGARRTSASGRSHVFEREAARQGAAVDLGVSLAASLSGDGATLGVPTLAAR